MKIYFCESCGASVPLQEVVGGRATASDGKVYCSHHLPGSADGDLKLYFCDACGVSIPLQDVITGTAATGGEQTLCPQCVRREKSGERSGDRFQLYFCDSCNTSIPQSHVVTGRALVRGGKTYCEGCRDRVGRKLSPVIPVLGVVALAAIALALVFAFGGAKEPAGPDPVALVGDLERDVGGRLDRLENDGQEAYDALDRRLREAREARAVEIGKLGAQVKLLGDLSEERDALLIELKTLRTEVDRLRPLEQTVARIPELEKELARLRQLMESMSRAPAQPPDVEPRPEPEPVKPEPAKAEIPDEVRVRIERLASPDSGIRFSAAVELGKLGHPAAVESLGNLLRKDEDLFVRRAAARAIGEIKSRDGAPALIDALTDSEIYVSLQAAKSLRAITGKEMGFKESLSMSQRRTIQTKWRKWWETHGKK